MSNQQSLSYESFVAHRRAQAELEQQYQSYLMIVDRLRKQRRRQKVITVSAVVGAMFLGFCSIAYAAPLQAAGVPGADVLLALRNLVPTGALSELMRADFIAAVHGLAWVASVMDDR